jgi:hypothetical protein
MTQQFDPQRQCEVDSSIPAKLTREMYEALCVEQGVPMRSDAEIVSREYGLVNAEFSRSDWMAMSREKRVAWQIEPRRLAGIKAERKSGGGQRVAVEMVQCDCGHSVAKHLVMRASCGTACADCYDRMSESHANRRRFEF